MFGRPITSSACSHHYNKLKNQKNVINTNRKGERLVEELK